MPCSFASDRPAPTLRRRLKSGLMSGRVPILVAVAIAALLVGPIRASAVVRVVTTSQSFADIVRRIGGDQVHVESIMRGPENPHNVRPKPSYMMKLRRADLFVHSGLDAEAWAPLLVKGARKSHLLPGQPGNIDASKGITLKEVPKRGELSRALGDIHVFGNPHYLGDPLNALVVGRTILNALKRTDLGHADLFQTNYEAFAKDVRDTTDRLVAKMKPYWGTKLVIYHRAWPYFRDRFGLVKVAEVEPKPGITPGPRHLRACIDKMKAAGARLVVVETFSNHKDAEFVAQKGGGKAVVLALDVRALPGCDSYLGMIEYDVNTLIAALRDAGVEPHAAAAGASKTPGAHDVTTDTHSATSSH